MGYRLYLVLVIVSFLTVGVGSYYLYSNISSPLEENIKEILDSWKSINENEENLAKAEQEMVEVMTANLTKFMVLQIQVELLKQENKRLRESLKKAMDALSQKKSSANTIPVIGILIAIIAMLPSWVELFFKFKKMAQEGS